MILLPDSDEDLLRQCTVDTFRASTLSDTKTIPIPS